VLAVWLTMDVCGAGTFDWNGDAVTDFNAHCVTVIILLESVARIDNLNLMRADYRELERFPTNSLRGARSEI